MPKFEQIGGFVKTVKTNKAAQEYQHGGKKELRNKALARNTKRNQQGFTLIELLVVMVFIFVFAVIGAGIYCLVS